MKTISVMLLSALAATATGSAAIPAQAEDGQGEKHFVRTADTSELQGLKALAKKEQAILTLTNSVFAPAVAGDETSAEIAFTAPGGTNQPPQAEPARLFEHSAEPTLRLTRPGEINVGKGTLSGILVAFFKAENPLQLLNPVAPPQYGSGTASVDTFFRGGTGPSLRLFSFGF